MVISTIAPRRPILDDTQNSEWRIREPAIYPNVVPIYLTVVSQRGSFLLTWTCENSVLSEEKNDDEKPPIDCHWRAVNECYRA